MKKVIDLTFTQCKQLINNGYDLREFIELVENQPDFIKEGGAIDSVSELQAIQQGGCASGSYMPAVTYYTASKTMAKYGDEVLDYIESQLGELPTSPKGESWRGMAVFYLSYAVELWASQFDLTNVDWD